MVKADLLIKGVPMTKKLLSIVIFIAVGLVSWKSAVAGNLNREILEHEDNSGAVNLVCLDDQIPVFIKKKDKNLYFVRVRNRYSGEVRAGSFGEARNIACSKKTNLILYNGTR